MFEAKSIVKYEVLKRKIVKFLGLATILRSFSRPNRGFRSVLERKTRWGRHFLMKNDPKKQGPRQGGGAASLRGPEAELLLMTLTLTAATLRFGAEAS